MSNIIAITMKHRNTLDFIGYVYCCDSGLDEEEFVQMIVMENVS